MSNFLDNLVARTLNLAPVVQPRLASRFEPVGPAGAMVVAEENAEVQAPPPPEPRVMTKIVESHVAKPAPAVAAPQVEREQPNIDVQQVINTVRNTYVESREVVQVPVVEKIHERVNTETRIHTEKTDSRVEIRENQTPVAPPKEIEKIPLNPRLQKSEPAPRPREAPLRTSQPTAPQLTTRIEPAPTVKPQRLDVQPVFQPEPTETINVTIGRVDVRAVFSAQAPKTPVRTAATSSLDDYLKQRSEGRR